jgi:hypothetical protein
MAQIKKPYTDARIPFAKMSYSPDVPSAALGANEYNAGRNVECDVRGVRSIAGDQEILSTVTGTPNYISGGFRADGYFWYIVATDEGKWWAAKDTTWIDITPTNPNFDPTGYNNQGLNITEAWNGTIPFFNDTLNPPLFWPDGDTTLRMYSNLLPASIDSIAYYSPTEQIITLSTAYAVAPYAAGDEIVISGVDTYYNGTFTVTASTTTTITYLAVPGAAYTSGGSVAPAYVWNYNPNWKSYTAGFLRMYSTPNVGNILVAGNLTVTKLDNSVVTFPTTVQWSQAFGLNQAPLSWEPTITNVANQLEVPLRGPALDAFPAGGNFYISSYWDTVIFNPINYSTTSAPILGVRLFNQGRGLLSSNCWSNADQTVYGVDARDIWVFDGSNFNGLGNQRVKNWFFDQLDPLYVDRVFTEVNTQKNQFEIYYPTTDAINGVPNKMLSYRYDIDCWNAPREVDSATFTCESPAWTLTGATYTNVSGTNLTGTGTGLTFDITVQGTQYLVLPNIGGASGYAVGNTIKVAGNLVGGATPANDITITVIGLANGYPEFISSVGNANGTETIHYGSRCVVYARGVTDKKIVQKDQGYSFINSQPIVSAFRRDNIQLLGDYSGKLMVHRVLPEVVNLDSKGIQIDPTTQPELIGGLVVSVEGQNSVGQAYAYPTTNYSITTNTNDPWLQYNQNSHRVNSIELGNSSNNNIWMCTATTWQFTQVEDDR